MSISDIQFQVIWRETLNVMYITSFYLVFIQTKKKPNASYKSHQSQAFDADKFCYCKRQKHGLKDDQIKKKEIERKAYALI